MFKFLKKVGKGLGGIVKKALPYAVGGIVGGTIFKKRKEIAGAIGKGVNALKNLIANKISQGKTPAEAEAEAVEEMKKKEGFPWLIVGLAGAAVVVVIVIIIIISSSGKRH
jgi:hypothetical protein